VDSARHVINRILNPRLLSYMTSYDAASTIHQFLMDALMDGARPVMICILNPYYDKQPKAINFRALAQKFQLKNLEPKVTISIIRRDVASFDSRILS